MGGFKYKSIFYGVHDARVRLKQGWLKSERGTKNCVLPWKPMLFLIDRFHHLSRNFRSGIRKSFPRRLHTRALPLPFFSLSLFSSTLVYSTSYDAIEINLKCCFYENNQLNRPITRIMTRSCELSGSLRSFLSTFRAIRQNHHPRLPERANVSLSCWRCAYWIPAGVYFWKSHKTIRKSISRPGLTEW